MTDCPKCGGSMRGPRYCSGRNFECNHDWSLASSTMDHLAWTCQTCGYTAATPTKHATATPEGSPR